MIFLNLFIAQRSSFYFPVQEIKWNQQYNTYIGKEKKMKRNIKYLMTEGKLKVVI